LGLWYNVGFVSIKVGLLIASMRTGGKERMTAAVLQHLDRAQFDPFLCVMKDGELLDELSEQRVYKNLARFRGDVWGFAWRLLRVLQQERPAVLVCLSYRLPGWVGRFLAWGLGVPLVIYELHGVERPDERDLDWFDRHIFDRITHHMIAIGAEFKQNLLRDGVAAQKITVIPNGVDTARFAPLPDKSVLGLAAGVPVIGCMTKMRPKKNLPLLVDAFAIVQRALPQARLVIVGDGAERPTLVAHIQRLGLGESVQLLGLRRDVPELMNAFDVVALSSTTEAAPLAILEAGACGVPVVATAVGELPDMVIEGITGFLVPSGDSAALAARLLEVLQDPALRQKMGQAARQHIAQNFSIQASVRARGALFLRLLG